MSETTVGATDDLAVCPACGERTPAGARFCMMCGARMVVDAGERRNVSVLFADLSGFTSYSEQVDVEAVKQLASVAADRLGEIVTRYGGTVDKVIGDCVMAVWGAPTTNEDDPERAVRAALDMQTYAGEHADEFAGLKLTIGVHTGEAIWAPVGPSGGYTVLGDTVNTAARLQGAAGRGEILIGEPTKRAVEDAIAVESVPPIAAKNKAEPVPAWRALGLAGQTRARLRRTPLIGRHLEMGRLVELWQRVRTDRSPALASLVGPAGIGKTRLIEAFGERTGPDARVLVGRCLPYGEGITYWPVTEIIRSAAGIHLDDDAANVSSKLGSLLEGLGIDDLDALRTMAVAVANLVAAPTTPRGTYTAEEISRGELHWGLRRLLDHLSARGPLVIVVEDLHWAEPTLIELIEYLVEPRDDARILVLATARPEFTSQDGTLSKPARNRRSIEIGPLDEDATRGIVDALVGASDGLGGIVEAAGGNPLFVEELVQMLVDSGAIDEHGRARGSLDGASIPGSLRSLIEARLDRLSAEERRVAGHASVVGLTFWNGAVEHIGAAPIGDELLELAARDVVRAQASSSIAGQDEFSFKHILLRDVAYGRLPKAERAVLHARCGEWIGELPGGDAEYVEFIAYHLEQACRLAGGFDRAPIEPPVMQAVDALKRAALKAENHEGTREADGFYARALDIVGDAYLETATDLRLSRSRTRAMLGDVEAAWTMLERVAQDALELGRLDTRSAALLLLATISGNSDPDRAHVMLEEVAKHAEQLGDRHLRTERALLSGHLRALYDGATDEVIDALDEALEMARAGGDRMQLIGAHQRLGNAYFQRADLARAEHHFTESMEVARSIGTVRAQAEATSFLATIKYHRGPREEAERFAHQTLTWLERNPDPYVEIQTLGRLGWLAVAREDLDDAERLMRRAADLARSIGGWLVVEMGRNLAAVLCLLGRVREARRASSIARKGVPDGDGYAAGVASLAEAFVAAAERDEPAARAAFTEALDLIAGEPLDLALARVHFARALRSFGDSEAARSHLELARDALTAAGADASVADVERELAR